MKKRVFSAVSLLILLTLVINSTAFARASEYIFSYSAWAENYGNNKILFSFDVNATQTSDVVGATEVKIEYKDGSTWKTAHTYNSSNATGLTGTNRVGFTTSVSYTGTAGKTYRATVTVYVKRGTGSDSRTVMSNEISL